MASKKINIRGTLKQDLTAARAELKQFRHDVSILKKKGLLDKNIYDARSVTPTKYLKNEIKKFASVLSGKAQVVKVSKDKKSYYAKKGYVTKAGKVVVPVKANEKAYSTHGDFRIKVSGNGGSITKIDLGLSTTDINQWVEDLANNKYKTAKDEILTFQFFGNNSHKTFLGSRDKTRQQMMAEHIMGYYTLKDTDAEGKPDKITEVLEGITILKIKRDPVSGEYPVPVKNFEAKIKDEEQIRRATERRRKNYEGKIGRMSDEQYERFRAEKAEIERERRKNLSPEKKAAYKRASKERVKKSRAKNKR